MWACGPGQTHRQKDTQTRVTTIHFSWSTSHAKCNKLTKIHQNYFDEDYFKFRSIWKNIVLLLQGWEQFATLSYTARCWLKAWRHRPYSLSWMRFPVTSINTIDRYRKTSPIFIGCPQYSRWPTCKAWEETTVCYKRLPCERPKLQVPRFSKSHKLQTQRLETRCWLSVSKIIDAVPYLLKLFENVIEVQFF